MIISSLNSFRTRKQLQLHNGPVITDTKAVSRRKPDSRSWLLAAIGAPRYVVDGRKESSQRSSTSRTIRTSPQQAA